MREALRDLYRRVRSFTEALAEPLAVEDTVVQTMPDVSPTKWHLAHTTWFFETFVLEPGLAGTERREPAYATLFNSYYNAVGAQFPRARRGLLSRPTLGEIRDYRRSVDEAMERFFATAPEAAWKERAHVVEVGLNHEEQHQELVLTDVKHVLCTNPLHPAYRTRAAGGAGGAPSLEWRPFPGGLVETGFAGEGFAFDNEMPRHRVYLEPFAIASRLTTAGEFLAFMADGGYARPTLWLSDGWAAKEAHGWRAPLYWEEQGGRWWQATLGGFRAVDPAEPVCHVSHYEADAFARWAGARLPREEEWESAAERAPLRGNFVEEGRLHPRAARGEGDLEQLFGDCWEWTASAYAPYPGYRPFAGELGEYNGKFMSNQVVLRGGSCATSLRHVRPTYRNFFPPDARWQFSGIRLAR